MSAEGSPDGASARAPDPRLLDAAEVVLLAHGWDGLTVDAVAAAAGVSRVTAWRQGGTKDALVDALINRLGADYRAAMWPVLTSAGTGRTRLEQGLHALCDVTERHLPLLLSSDMVFHRDSSAPVDFTEPFVRLVADARADGSLQPAGSDGDAATALFNTVCWSYVHLRGRHDWPPGRTRRLVLGLVLHGVNGGAGEA